MSKLVDTELGQFRYVIDGNNKQWFLFECPHCHEMLPMSEEVLAGRAPVDHESRIRPSTFCTFGGQREFGKSLICAMQAQTLMGYQPYHDEGQDHWQPLP